MKKYLILILLIFSTGVTSQTLSKFTVPLCASLHVTQVVIMAGQSNINGSDQTDTDSLDAEYQGNLPAKILVGSAFVTLNATVTNNNQYPYKAGYFSSEVSLAKDFYDVNSYELYIVKFAVGGTALAAGAGADWAVASHELYDSVVNVTTRARAYLTGHGMAYNIKAFIWYQGEADMGVTTDADAYLANFQTLVGSLRTALSLPNLNVIGIRPSWDPTNADHIKVRDAFSQANNGLSYYTMMNVDDLTLSGVHLTDESQITLGKRINTILTGLP